MPSLQDHSVPPGQGSLTAMSRGAYPVGGDAVLQGQHRVHAPLHVRPRLHLLLPLLLANSGGRCIFHRKYQGHRHARAQN